MKPTCFPFTVISKKTMDAITAHFKSVAVYQPSADTPNALAELAEKGLLEIRCPVQDNEDKLKAVMKEYKKWAELHQGADLSVFKFHQQEENISIAQLRADLKNYSLTDGLTQPQEKSDPVFNARLFLKIAQDFDSERLDMEQELSSFEKMEKSLFEELRGEDATEIELPSKTSLDITEDAGAFMTHERLNAWTRLMLQDSEVSEFFVTTSRAVFDFLAEKTPHLKPYSSEDNPPCESLNVYVAEGESPRVFFARCAGIRIDKTPEEHPDTFIGLLNI